MKMVACCWHINPMATANANRGTVSLLFTLSVSFFAPHLPFKAKAEAAAADDQPP